MPIIEINNPNSLAHGKLAAWFDTKKQRRGSKKARDEALKRLNEHRKAKGEPPLRRKDIHSSHHLNKDRNTASGENLFSCVSEQQHTHIELQGTELFTTLFNMGKIGFDYVTKKYFIACKKLEDDIREWIANKSPRQWVILERGHNGDTNSQQGTDRTNRS